MTKAEWEEAERTLIFGDCPVYLKADGYNLCLVTVPDKGLQRYIIVLVDGKAKLEWIDKDCEIRRKFYNKRTKSMVNKSKLKNLPAKEQKIILDELGKYEYVHFTPVWTSFSRLKSHLTKNNSSIELVPTVYTNL